MLQEHPQLFVSWRSPTTRLIHPVGRLTQDPATHSYEFCYIRAVAGATIDGFVPFPEFPSLQAYYRAHNLFPVFANRVMPKSRPDYHSFLDALGLSRQTDDPMVILARTGGTRQTDQIELIPAPKSVANGCYLTYFLLRAIKYMPEQSQVRLAKLQPGEQLILTDDVQNPVDPTAMAVWTDDEHQIGYLPAYLTPDVKKLRELCPEGVKLLVERYNPPPAEAHHRLLCQLVSCWPSGFIPFADERFQPVTASHSGAA